MDAGAVIGVVGGSGGAGASTFAAVLAYAAADAVLVDLDGNGGGIDVLLGIEQVAGARWSQLRLGGGWLDPELLSGGLPRWGGVPVLAADVGEPAAAAVVQVLESAAARGPLVLDLPRAACPARDAALPRCDLVTVMVRATVPGVVAARAVVDAMATAPVGVVIRRGALRAQEVGRVVGVPVLGVVTAGTAGGDHALRPDAVPSRLLRVAAGVLDGMGAGPAGGRGSRTVADVAAGIAGSGRVVA